MANRLKAFFRVSAASRPRIVSPLSLYFFLRLLSILGIYIFFGTFFAEI